MPSKSRNPSVVLWVVLTCQLMVVLDATVVNIALPDIKTALGFSSANLSWTINAYVLTFGGLLLLGARVGDILGHRVAFNGGVALFTLSSLLGGLAQNSGELLGARALQGIGAALASPSSLAILTQMFTEGKERTKAIGLYTAVSIGGGALGLILGGALTQLASWRWVLLINVPIGIVVSALAWRHIEGRERRTGSFDLPGALTSTLGMGSLTFGFVQAAEKGWGSTATIVSFAVGLVLLGGFITIERSVASPITPLRLFADRNRAGAYLGRLLLVAGMQGMFFFLSQFMQEVLGYSPLATGLGFLPITIAVFTASQLSSRFFVERFGPRRVMALGMTFSTLAMAWITGLGAHSGYANVFGPLVLMGLGNGLAFVPLTGIALAGVRPEDAGAGAGLVNAMQQVGGAVGLSVLVTVSGSFSRGYVSDHRVGQSAKELGRNAFIHGADAAFVASALLLLVCLITTTLFVRTPRSDPHARELEEFPTPEVIEV